MAVEGEVLGLESVTSARRRDADEPQGGRGDVAAIAAAFAASSLIGPSPRVVSGTIRSAFAYFTSASTMPLDSGSAASQKSGRNR